MSIGTSLNIPTINVGNIALIFFDAAPGERVGVGITNISPACTLTSCLTVQLYDPHGVRLGESSPTTDIDSPRPLAAGTHAILVDPGSQSRSLSLTLSQPVTQPDGGATLTIGGPTVQVTINSDRPGQDARISFEVPPERVGQRLRLTTKENTMAGLTYCTNVTIFNPNGTVLAPKDCVGTTESNIDTPTLPVQGTYTIVIDPQSHTGSIKLTLAQLLVSRQPFSTAAADMVSAGATDAATPFITVSWRDKTGTSEGASTENGAPALHRSGGDPSGRSAAQTILPPLEVPAGVTALAGQVLRLDGRPLASVTLEIEGQTTQTDSRGRFLLSEVPPGRHVLIRDGRTTGTPGRTCGVFEVGVDLAEGVTTVLPYTIWLSEIDTTHTVACGRRRPMR